jgi:hypothetical protein
MEKKKKKKKKKKKNYDRFQSWNLWLENIPAGNGGGKLVDSASNQVPLAVLGHFAHGGLGLFDMANPKPPV